MKYFSVCVTFCILSFCFPLFSAGIPSSISNLTALSGEVDGSVRLNWTAPSAEYSPYSNPYGSPVNYIIKYATYPVLGDMFYDTGISTYNHAFSSWKAVSLPESRLLTGFSIGSTYYFAVNAINQHNDYGLWVSSFEFSSTNSLNYASAPLVRPVPLRAVTGIAGYKQVQLRWISTGDDGTAGNITSGAYEIRYSTANVITTENDWSQAQFSYSRTGIDFILDSWFSGQVIITGLTNYLTYYFSVKIRDENTDGWSGVDISTRVKAMPYNPPPDVFSSISPSNFEVVLTSSPVLRWEQASDPDTGSSLITYSILITSYPAWTTYYYRTGISTLSWIMEIPLSDNTTYYWQAEAIDPDGGRRLSARSTFYINSVIEPPEAFGLIYPVNGAVSMSAFPVLSWNPAPDPDPRDFNAYTIYVSTDESFAVSSSSEGINLTSGTVSPALTENLKYWWYVRATDSYGLSVNSATDYFWVNTGDDDPVTFSLISPSTGSKSASKTVVLDWEDCYDPDPPGSRAVIDYYQVFYNIGGTVPTESVVRVQSSSASITVNNDNSIYRWRVYAVFTSGVNRYSTETFSFAVDTQPEPPLPSLPLSPMNNSSVTYSTFTFSWSPSVDPDPYETLTYSLLIATYPAQNAYFIEITSITSPFRLTTSYYILSENSVYYWKIKTRDSTGNIEYSTSTFSFINNLQNEAPGGFSLQEPENLQYVPGLKPTFYWTAAADPEGMAVYYNLFISTAQDFSGVLINPSGLSRTNYSFETAGLTLLEQRTYYWKVRAYDAEGSGVWSGVNSFMTAGLPPLRPEVLIGEMLSSNSVVRLKWNAVTKNSDGSAADDIAGYYIYRATSVVLLANGSYRTPPGLISNSMTTFSESVVPGIVYYYLLRVVDNSYLLSAPSNMFSTSLSEAVTGVSSDLGGAIALSREDSASLSKENNFLGEDLKISAEKITGTAISDGFITGYEFRITGQDSGNDISLSLQKPMKVKMSVSAVAFADRNKISVYYFNGVEWIKTRTVLETSGDYVSANVSRPGRYAIKYALPASDFTLNKTVPSSVFTPNSDGINDLFCVYYENPLGEQVSGVVYDISMRFISNMKQSDIVDMLYWDGKKEDASPSTLGLYFYQVRTAGGKAFSGTIALAR